MQEEQDYSSHALFRAILLLGFFLLLFRLLVSGDIYYYIAPKMVPFSYFALVILLVLGLMQLWRSGAKNREELYCNCGFSHTQTGSPLQTFFIYALFVLPVVTGLWFPETVLDSSIVANRGVAYGAGFNSPLMNAGYDEAISEEDNGYEVDEYPKYMEELKNELLESSKIIVNEERYRDITTLFYTYPDLFLGKEIEMVGFVYREPDLEDNQFVLARFEITCCVADAIVVGVLAAADEKHNVKEDEWVRATGQLSKTMLDNREYPYLQITELEKIAEPENPYIY